MKLSQPALATFFPSADRRSLRRGRPAVKMKLKDISLTGRIIRPTSPTKLTPAQRKINDEASPNLAQLAMRPAANIIKLPNISASIPQLKAAIKELQSKGFTTCRTIRTATRPPADKEIRARYGQKVLGRRRSIRVLREGNSDRPAPPAPL